MNEPPDDAAIAEFHAAARKRNVRIFSIAAACCLVIGIAILVVVFLGEQAVDEQGHFRRYEVRTILAGIGFIVAAGGFGRQAYRTAKRLD